MNVPALIAIERRIETAMSFMQGSTQENITARRELAFALRELETLRRMEPGQDRRAYARRPQAAQVSEIDGAELLPVVFCDEDADVRRFIHEHPQLAADPRARPRLPAPEARAE